MFQTIANLINHGTICNARLRQILFGAALLLSFAATAASGDDASLRVDIVSNAPWGMASEADQTLIGILPEISAAIARESGLTLRQTLVPLQRAKHDLSTGETDLAFLLHSTKRDVFVYAGHLLDVNLLAIPRKGLKLGSVNELGNLRVGVYGDASDYQTALRGIPIHYQELSRCSCLLKMLLADRLDAIIMSDVSWHHVSDSNRAADKVGDALLLQHIPLWVYFSPRSKHLAESANILRAVNKLSAAGYFEQVLGRYVGKGKCAE